MFLKRQDALDRPSSPISSTASAMRLKLRKLAQAVGLSCFVALFFLTILGNLGVTVDRGTLPEIRRVSNKFPTSWQERAPRSILAEEPSSGENLVIVKPDVVVNDSITEPTSTAASVGLDDVFISVKTTKMFHESRLDVIIKTWFKLAPKQTYFFTDAEDPVFQKKTGGRMINTKCQPSHNRKALCCKMSVEFDTFLDSGKKWFCHFDDDNYVNVPKLVQLLARYDPQENVYLGKPSIPAPLEIPTTSGSPNNAGKESSSKISFWFATGGAGFCISRSLAMKMMPVASGGKFISIGDKIRLPDDVTMGYIIEHLLGQQLTVIDGFHSHLEPMKSISSESLGDQITFSYSKYWFEANTLPIEGFDMEVDPTRFLSLHCILFPKMPMCHGMKHKGRKVEYNKKA